MSQHSSRHVGKDLLLLTTQSHDRQETGGTQERWGATLLTKADATVRVILQNVNGLPQYNNNTRNEQWRIQFEDLQADVWLFTESNLNWDRLPFSQRLPERTREWWPMRHCVTSHNRNDSDPEAFQPGGVGILTRGGLTHRIFQAGTDESGLGRWCWIRIRGRSGRFTRIISAYRPVMNQQGPSSVYNQHQRHMLEHHRHGCPRELFIQDLYLTLRQWVEEGDLILLGVDFNDDVRTSPWTRKLNELGIVETIITNYGTQGPATYQRGRRPIDGLYTSVILSTSLCGYLAFGEGLVSDHRPLWVDLPLQALVGEVPQLEHPRIRRLQCRDPRTVARFLAHYRVALDQSNVVERVQTLRSQVSTTLTAAQQREWESLDDKRVQAMLTAEQHCRKLKMGSVAWSPEIQRAIEAVTYWQLQRKRLLKGKVASKRLARLRRAITHAQSIVTVDQANLELQAARKHYRELKSRAIELRVTWLEGLAHARASMAGGTPASHLSQLRHREQARRDSRIIKSVLGQPRGKLVMVQTTQADGRIVDCESQEAIEQACLRENVTRFQQASSTPFLQPPLNQLIDPAATTPMAQRILEGTWETQIKLPNPITRVLRAFKRIPRASEKLISTVLTPDEYVRRWSRSREYTATGKSGIHFGHFIAGLRDSTITMMESNMAQIPLQTGYAPKRWCQGLDLAILKKPNQFHVEALRTLQLFEPDFNALNKILAHRTMWNAERLELLAPEQYGSRRNRSAAEHALNKRLTFDITRQTRTSLAVCSIDAKSCYDRIVWPIASLALQRLGAPSPPLAMMIHTLQNMKHYLLTSYGVSDTHYDANNYPSFHGVGQGNGAAPAIWAAISSPLLHIQRENGFAARFQAPLSKDLISLAGFAFVDDTDLCQTGEGQDTPAQLAARMQQSLDSWTDSLHVTGGALVPAKSFWVNIQFTWKDGCWQYGKPNPTTSLIMRDSEGISQTIEQIASHDGRRTLGVRLAPDGNNQAEVSYLRTCCEEWSNKIQQSRLPRHLVWTALHRRLWPKLIYPLPATTLTRQECEYIMSPALAVGLSASGIVRTFPRVIAHAPTAALGLNIPHLHDVQGWAHITSAVKHGSDERSVTGRLLRCSIQHLKIEIGLPGGLFLCDYDLVGSLATTSWVKTLWEYLWENDLKLEETTPSLTLNRQNDRFLTELFLQLGFRNAELRALNRCRLYLQVTTLSDIATGDGRFVTPKARNGEREIELPRAHNWPNQGKPTRSDWQCWQRAWAQYCQSSAQSKLPQALGPWTTSTPQLAWCWSPSVNRLYRQIHHDTWVFHLPSPSRSGRSTGRRFTLQAYSVPSDELPSDLLRGMAVVTGSQILTSGFSSTITIPPTSSHATLLQSLTAPTPGTLWVYPDCQLLASEESICAALEKETVLAVSDGSFRQGKATASWVIATRGGQLLLRGSLNTPGDAHDLSAMRGELSGIYAAILTLERITSFFHIGKREFEIGCDNKGALARSFSTDTPQPSQPNYDFITAIRSVVSHSQHIFLSRYIPAHQDCLGHELDLWAQLNIKADQDARAYHLHGPTTRPDDFIMGEAWVLTGRTKKFTCLARNTFYSIVAAPKGRSYWEKKKQFPPEVTPQIAWGKISAAMETMTQSRRQWIVKHATGRLATGSQMKRYGYWLHDHCPHCGESETGAHLMLCPAPPVQNLWQVTLADLRRWFDEHHTHPEIRDFFLHLLSTWARPEEGMEQPSLQYSPSARHKLA